MEILICPKDLEKIPISRKIRGRRYKILSLLKSTLEELNYENLIESSMIVSKKGNLIEGGLSLDNFKNRDRLIGATVATILEFNRRFLEIYKNYLGIPLHCFILGDKGCLLVMEAGPMAILACRINQKIKSSADEDLIHLKIATSKCAVNIANVINELIPFKEIPELERIQANLLNK